MLQEELLYHLSKRLLSEGFIVIGVDIVNDYYDVGLKEDRLKQLIAADNFSNQRIDLADRKGLEKIFQNNQIDAVVNLAAQAGVRYSLENPHAYVDTNIKGTLNILQATKDNGTERIFITSTSEVYGTAQYVPIDEAHPFQGQSPYSATKIAADRLAESFYRSFDVPVTIVRPFNTYGPRQSARAVIPTIITQLLAGKRSIKLGSLGPVRDFNYVLGLFPVYRELIRVGDKTNKGGDNIA